MDSTSNLFVVYGNSVAPPPPSSLPPQLARLVQLERAPHSTHPQVFLCLLVAADVGVRVRQRRGQCLSTVLHALSARRIHYEIIHLSNAAQISELIRADYCQAVRHHRPHPWVRVLRQRGLEIENARVVSPERRDVGVAARTGAEVVADDAPARLVVVDRMVQAGAEEYLISADSTRGADKDLAGKCARYGMSYLVARCDLHGAGRELLA